jgi:hypothetical protein
MRTLSLFLCLQLADFVTTALAMRLGGGETNPLVLSLMAVGPITGLILAKAIVAFIGIGAAATGRYKGLRFANVAFLGVVCWNMVIIGRLALRSSGV